MPKPLYELRHVPRNDSATAISRRDRCGACQLGREVKQKRKNKGHPRGTFFIKYACMLPSRYSQSCPSDGTYQLVNVLTNKVVSPEKLRKSALINLVE